MKNSLQFFENKCFIKEPDKLHLTRGGLISLTDLSPTGDFAFRHFANRPSDVKMGEWLRCRMILCGLEQKVPDDLL